MRHLFYLFFTFHCFRPRVKKFNVSNSLRFMHPCVSGAIATFMQPFALVQVIGVARIEASIAAEEDVHLEGHWR